MRLLDFWAKMGVGELVFLRSGSDRHRSSVAYEILSRTLNVLVAAAGLLALFPLLLLLGVAVKRSTGSSSLFRQVRLGRRAHSFTIFKFRTVPPWVTPDPNRELVQCLATPLGKALRAKKIDELPQLYNVLRGDMALVGPRPTPAEEYTAASHHERMAVRPGLTGLWQVSPARNNPFDADPQYDRFYLAHRCLGLDLWIIWRTAMLLLAGRETDLTLAAARWAGDRSQRKAQRPSRAHIPPLEPSASEQA